MWNIYHWLNHLTHILTIFKSKGKKSWPRVWKQSSSVSNLPLQYLMCYINTPLNIYRKPYKQLPVFQIDLNIQLYLLCLANQPSFSPYWISNNSRKEKNVTANELLSVLLLRYEKGGSIENNRIGRVKNV